MMACVASKLAGVAVGLGCILGLDTDVVGIPFDSLDEGVKVKGTSGVGELFGDELGEAIVAFADAEETVAFGSVFGGLLEGEGGYADDAVVGGVEAFDVADGGVELVVGSGCWVRYSAKVMSGFVQLSSLSRMLVASSCSLWVWRRPSSKERKSPSSS